MEFNLEKIRDFIKEDIAHKNNIHVSLIDLENPFQIYNYDSMDYLELVFELEKYFEISIAEPDFAKCKNFNQLATFIYETRKYRKL